MSSKAFNPKPSDKICFNCRHYRHMIGIGLGVRCGHPSKSEPDELAPLLPSRSHSCGLFEYRAKQFQESKDDHSQ